MLLFLNLLQILNFCAILMHGMALHSLYCTVKKLLTHSLAFSGADNRILTSFNDQCIYIQYLKAVFDTNRNLIQQPALG